MIKRRQAPYKASARTGPIGRSGGRRCLRAAAGPGDIASGLAKQVLALLEVGDFILERYILRAGILVAVLQHLRLDFTAALVHLRHDVLQADVDRVEALDGIDQVGVVLGHQGTLQVIDQLGGLVVVKRDRPALSTGLHFIE